MQGTLGPVRTFEALVYQRLMAIAYAKIDLLHGMLMPLQDSGPQMKFAVFDANQPMIGEMLDYAFEVQVSDEITDADQVQSILQMADFLGKLAQPLQMVGKTVRWDILASEAARKSGLPRAAELIVDLPPPPPQMAPPGQAAAGQPQPGGPPPQAPEQQTDPRQLLAQLYAALKGMKEGDPRENQVLTMIAQIQAGAQQQVAA